MSQQEVITKKKKKEIRLEDFQGRVPPQNIQAEEAVLGAILIYNEALHQVLNIVQSTDFYLEKHKWIYEAFLDLERDNQPIDALSVANIIGIQDQKKLDQVGGLVYLAGLADRVPTAANVAYYAQIVKEKSVVRQLIKVGTEIVGEAYEDVEDVFSFLDTAERRIFDIREDRSTKDLTPAKEIVRDAFKTIEALFDKKEMVTGVPTGFDDFDEMTSGLQPSDLVILAARPSMGKAQPLDAQVKTPTGWVCMGELQIGDALASPDGQESHVVEIFPQGEKAIFQVVGSDGRTTECCAEHLWSVMSPSWKEPRVVTTHALMEQLTTSEEGFYLPSFSGSFGHKKPLPLSPKRLALWYASRLWKRSEAILFSTLEHQALVSLHLEHITPAEAHIPELYLEASRELRMQLLEELLKQGLFSEHPGQRGQATALIQSEHFARDLLALIRSVGGWASLSKAESITQPMKLTVQCPLPSAQTLMEDATHSIRIVSIKPVRRAEAQCIRVSHPSSLYITDQYIVTHNTALALNIATNAAVFHQRPVAIFSLEMSKEQLMNRMMCLLGRVSGQRMRTGQMKDDDIPRLFETAERLAKAPVFIDDSGDLGPLEVRAKCRRLKMEQGDLGMVIIDYLQLMRGDTASASREREISEISRGLKILAKELNCPVVALSQLNRSLERRPDKRPIMSDLRESGAIEQDADVIMFVYRDEVYNEDTEEKGIAEIIIGKQRNGPIGTVRLRFIHEYTRFDNLYPGDL